MALKRIRIAMAAAIAWAGIGVSGVLAQGTPKYTNAEVLSINAQQRLLVVRTNDGAEQTLELDDQVSGLAELRAGDRVILTMRGEPGRPRVQAFSKTTKVEASASTRAEPVVTRAEPVVTAVDRGDEELRAAESYSRRLADLAAQATAIDNVWSGFRTACNVTLERRRLRGIARVAEPVGLGAGRHLERLLPRPVQPDRRPRPVGERRDGRGRDGRAPLARAGRDPRDPAAVLARVARLGQHAAQAPRTVMAARREGTDGRRSDSQAVRRRGAGAGGRAAGSLAPGVAGGRPAGGHGRASASRARGPVARASNPVRKAGAASRAALTAVPRTDGLDALDRDRAASLADEGGSAAATVEGDELAPGACTSSRALWGAACVGLAAAIVFGLRRTR